MKAQQYHYPVGCDELSRGSDIRWPNLLVLTDSTCRVPMSVKKNSLPGQPRYLLIPSLYLSKKEFRNRTLKKSAWRQSQESKTKCMLGLFLVRLGLLFKNALNLFLNIDVRLEKEERSRSLLGGCTQSLRLSL